MINRRKIILDPFLSGSFRNNISGTASYGNDLTNFVISGSFIGNFLGSSSYALSASYAPSSPSVSASYALSASYANNVISSSYSLSASYAPSSPSVSASYALSASYANNVLTSSYALSASYAPSSPSVSASYALSASYAPSSPSISASYSLSASYSNNALSASYILTASYSNKSLSSSYAENTAPIISSSYALSASYVNSVTSASYALSASYTKIALSASYAPSVSASYADNALSASYTIIALSSSYSTSANTASYSISASYFDGTVLRVPSINTGINANGTIFAKSTNQISLSSSAHAFTAGGESNDHNLILGEYGTGTGMQSRNNGAIGALNLNPLGGDVRIGSSYAGIQNFTVFNTDTGTGSYIEMGLRNGAGTVADSLLFRILGTGFTTSGMNFQDGGMIGTGINILGGLSLGTQADSDLRLYTHNLLRLTISGSTGVVKIADLGGSGNVMVVSDNDGNLSTQSIPGGLTQQQVEGLI